ncbi:MAG: bifunctional 4-hydroxy-2-oxoglutarate aldolase/2-dehydro-3-deoxy-phosphogluconate aldolase [Clostridium sp.]|jgi:2-dehydro-3-deoxyphosphogluconate aldolase/(4S)-4-hydroxy-2-oxoglutarate aldolase|uniref:bifunctional 4-hydroxy-2-oxoglutarate aldolase/2-dehydro-3-deoxy-phosphogluconate aldolase n=1 Tax=Clostridium sp. TaxID=1506 RepID=UPI0025C41EE8|nr:bifunctional 4-hydroxy-2-oxoglutarate aldolase/2-dehydro-3-deoxy-phosphogluconate aldolase [Clostridium sp.]MCH3965103.1 bifunctional 4-hydroxy-2-oxoglutarate aldolase/2-dehydro-3-deoxy-phosphogluconate aldolase [Clostridium sp.]MCI1714324.1 bifunctional 4-hydroxy-2-oxoglutarate aldolase/2-dehydro-3-deoxy-phosphogluconate aldolase [Clostridium sp.]MCI1798586.1 bifunctional 4-hydroxy-2-oxoglutarate aldolase/2-dehydro-3-deoxy-phosphogluconate aldolase [Clostridium sp.]MCI1812683.1 bifunctional
MDKYKILQQIKKNGVISIVRGTTFEQINKIADALYRGGVRLIEVTFNTPGASKMIESLTQSYSDKMIIGAGTVIDGETARIAILSGAQFILSPSLHSDVIQMCNKYDILAVPGVFTPTEAITAWRLGAEIVKIFPAATIGSNYIKQLLGPLKQLKIMAVGGISEENFTSFIQSGAIGAGIGSDLVDKKLADAENYDEIYRRAKNFTDIFNNIKK